MNQPPHFPSGNDPYYRPAPPMRPPPHTGRIPAPRIDFSRPPPPRHGIERFPPRFTPRGMRPRPPYHPPSMFEEPPPLINPPAQLPPTRQPPPFRDLHEPPPYDNSDYSSYPSQPVPQSWPPQQIDNVTFQTESYAQPPTYPHPSEDLQKSVGDMLHKLRHSADDSEESTQLGDEHISEDQKWVDQWLSSKGLQHVKHSTKLQKDDMKVSKVKSLMKESLQLLSELKTGANSLDVARKQEIMQRLQELKSFLTNESLLSQVHQRITKIQKKRARFRRKRIHDHQLREEMDKICLQKHQKLDKAREKVQEEELRIKREKELKAAADDALKEVHIKLADVSRFEDVLKAVAKLREVRKDKMSRKGMATSGDADKTFSMRETNMLQTLAHYKSIYEAEKKTLEVMLEMEQEESRQKEKELTCNKRAQALAKWERNLHSCLFGPKVKLDDTSDPLFSHRQYQMAAHYSSDALLHIRHEWDMYLVPEGVPGSSSIPPGWVLPVPPSNLQWESALKDAHR